MADKEIQTYADCIGCKSDNIVDILKDYIDKYDDPETITKYNLKPEDLLGSIRFLVTNITNDTEYYRVLDLAIRKGNQEILQVVKDYGDVLHKR